MTMLGLALSPCCPCPATIVSWGSCTAPNGNSYVFDSPTATAAFYTGVGGAQRDGAKLHYLAATGKYWLLGGWSPAPVAAWGNKPTTNQVWSSTDLITWTLELAHDQAPPTSGAGARWQRRHCFGSCVHTFGGVEYIYVLGSDDQEDPTIGEFPSADVMSDVWRSSDGVTWTRIRATSDWGPRFQPIVGVLDGRMHYMGGSALGTTTAQHWSSEDGDTWTQHTDMPFTRMAVYEAPSMCDKLFVIGGWEGLGNDAITTAKNDVWAYNGTDWNQQTAAAAWTQGVWVGTACFDNRLWVLTRYGNLADTWWSEDAGVTWTQTAAPPWVASHADAYCVTAADGLVLASGNLQEGNVYRVNVAPLTVTAITPSIGLAGTAITNLAGTGFAVGASVTIGGVACTSVTFVSATELECVVGAHANGVVDVVVTNTDLRTSGVTGAGLYTYGTATVPASLSLTGWWRAAFASSPWTGVASAGTSGGRTLTEATNPPTVGTALNTFDTANFDGVDDLLNGASAFSTYGAAAAGSLAFLVYADTLAADTGTVRTNAALLCDANTYFTVNVCDSGVAVNLYDVGWKATPYAALATGAWTLVQVRWDSTTLSVRTNNNAWQDVLAGAIDTVTGAITIGNGNAGPFFDGRMAEAMCAQEAFTTPQFDEIRDYINTRYALAI